MQSFKKFKFLVIFKLGQIFRVLHQAPKVEDLAQSEGTGCDEELPSEANTAIWGGAACSSDEAGGSGHRRA